MAKLTLSDISSGFNLETVYNNNNALIETALENTLSRDGTTPNSMSATLDMNSQRIINLLAGVNSTDAATLGQIQSFLTNYSPVSSNIRHYGAIANQVLNCNSAFASAGGACRTRASVLFIPEPDVTDHATFPGYVISTNPLASLYLETLTGDDGNPGREFIGGMTDCRGLLVLYGSSSVIIPNGHTFRGIGGYPTNNTTASGSCILAPSGSTLAYLVQLGRSNIPVSLARAPNSARIEKMLVNCRSQSNVSGIFSNSAQEACGIFDCAIIDGLYGVVFASSANISPANCTIERTHVADSTSQNGKGFDIYGTRIEIFKATSTKTHATAVHTAGYNLRGENIKLTMGHCEGAQVGCLIGGIASGVGADNNFWTYNITVDGFTGYNLNGQTAMEALVRIGNNQTNVFNIDIRNIALNRWVAASHPTPPLLIDDRVNGIEIPIEIPGTVNDNDLQLQYYRFGGQMGVDAGNTQKRPVYTSWYDRWAPTNPAVMARILDGVTATQDFDRVFAGGGRAGILQIHGTAAGVAEELRTINEPTAGEQVLLHFVDAVTIRTVAAGGVASLRILTETGANINAAANSFYRATYADVRGFAIDPATWGERWYVEAMP